MLIFLEEDNSVNSEDEVKLTETISVIDDDKIRVNTDLGGKYNPQPIRLKHYTLL